MDTLQSSVQTMSLYSILDEAQQYPKDTLLDLESRVGEVARTPRVRTHSSGFTLAKEYENLNFQNASTLLLLDPLSPTKPSQQNNPAAPQPNPDIVKAIFGFTKNMLGRATIENGKTPSNRFRNEQTFGHPRSAKTFLWNSTPSAKAICILNPLYIISPLWPASQLW